MQFTLTTEAPVIPPTPSRRSRDAVFPVPGGPEMYMDPGVRSARWVSMNWVSLASWSSRPRRVEGGVPWCKHSRALIRSKEAVYVGGGREGGEERGREGRGEGGENKHLSLIQPSQI